MTEALGQIAGQRKKYVSAADELRVNCGFGAKREGRGEVENP